MLEIGIDIGGTFTDIVGLWEGRRLYYTKVASTPKDLVVGVRHGTEKILALAGVHPAQVARFVHGTTVGTNAVLERKGAPVGLLMTAGFEDTLEMGRQKRSRMYDLGLEVETPVFLAPRRLRVGIPERIDAEGRELLVLDEDAVRASVSDLVARFGVRAIAVCYLFSFVNPAHEERTREIVRALDPEVRVSISSEIDPKFREYERVVLTAFDAYIRPVIDAYLERLEAELSELGIPARLQVIQSRGGVTSAATLRRRPITLLKSGLAGGVLGAKFAGARGGYESLITLDMGGTSNDVALIAEGKALTTLEGEISGYPLRVPMVDVSTIGAGGGSIAWLDASGGLRVGPQSAGAEPGPACYGRGGEAATVTDASVVLGYLNPDYFAGGELRLEAPLARQAVERIAGALGVDTFAAAAGIHRIINARMADQIRLVSIKRGYDPRRFVLVALGGAGPVHAARLASELEIPTVVVPETPGVLSAFGLLVAPFEHDHARAYTVRADSVDFARVEAIFQELDALGRQKMRADQIPAERVTFSRWAEMRYVGQSYELEVAIAEGLTTETLPSVVAAFHDRHEAVYGHRNLRSPVEFVSFRTVHAYEPDAPRLTRETSGRAAAGGPRAKAERLAYFAEIGEARPTPVYERAELRPGSELRGPAIVEQPDTTTVVYPGQRLRVDAHANLIIDCRIDGEGSR